jgi:hypothetical protein
MAEFIPVVETLGLDEGSFDWAMPAEPSLRWIAPGAGTSDSDIARVVAKLATANKIAMTGSLDSVISALSAEDDLCLSGGLLVQDEHMTIEPGELTLLNEWRTWYEVKPGARSPWLGNHPSQGVRCGDEFAEIDFDGVSGSIQMTYAQIERALKKRQLIFTHFRCAWQNGFIVSLDLLAIWRAASCTTSQSRLKSRPEPNEATLLSFAVEHLPADDRCAGRAQSPDLMIRKSGKSRSASSGPAGE